MQRSIELNDNRAVFRSRLILDEDLAVRSAGHGGIYRDLGFERLALIEGYQAISADPEQLLQPSTARGSLRQLAVTRDRAGERAVPVPASAAAQPVARSGQLGQASLFLDSATGPSDVSFNEFTPLFDLGSAAHPGIRGHRWQRYLG